MGHHHTILAISGLLALKFVYSLLKRQRQSQELKPLVEFTKGGSLKKLENFGDFVVRQLGLPNHGNSCLSAIAEKYLKEYKRSGDLKEDTIYSFISTVYTNEEIHGVYDLLIEELDSCLCSYFAFYWEHAAQMVNQVLSGYSDSKMLRAAVFAATRKQRFERTLKDLKAKQVFSTLVNQIGSMNSRSSVSTQLNIMEPIHHDDRSPVLLLIGGGMGAGKSTVVKDILKSSFWASASQNAVVVEADAFKETDVVYQALKSKGHEDIIETAELVHQASTDAASSVLVTALNDGRDVIFDGTMSWEPFVLQTIAMARDVHNTKYRMGTGYKVGADRSVQEEYWEPIKDENHTSKLRKPYRIEFVGMVCDAYLAVVRGLRRAIVTKRAVRVKSQLMSHKRFASALPNYVKFVDHAKIYSTNHIKGPAELIGWKDKNTNLLVNPEAFKEVKKLSMLNENASNVLQLYTSEENEKDISKIWKDLVSNPERVSRQKLIGEKIQNIETYLAKEGNK